MCIDFAPRYTEDGYRESFFEKHLRAAFEAGVAAQKATESSNTTTTAEETA
jgi:hypothetical protein